MEQGSAKITEVVGATCAWEWSGRWLGGGGGSRRWCRRGTFSRAGRGRGGVFVELSVYTHSANCAEDCGDSRGAVLGGSTVKVLQT